MKAFRKASGFVLAGVLVVAGASMVASKPAMLPVEHDRSSTIIMEHDSRNALLVEHDRKAVIVEHDSRNALFIEHDHNNA
ncbi:MAG: hypothetical protein ACYDAB_05795 [bacterium]